MVAASWVAGRRGGHVESYSVDCVRREPPDDEPTSGGGCSAGGLSAQLYAQLVRHLPFVRSFLRLRLDETFRARESVSDLVQSLCCDILARERGFEWRSEAEFRAWICNAALMKLSSTRRYHAALRRSVQREVRIDEDMRVSAIVAACAPGPVTAAIHAEEQARVERAFDALPERQREVLTLHRIAGLSHAEIAEQLGISVENSRQILNRAIAAFAARWEELDA